MSEEQRVAAYRLQAANRKVVQDALNALLTPVSQAAATQSRLNVEPIRQFQKEGPDVGQREEAESKQRI